MPDFYKFHPTQNARIPPSVSNDGVAPCAPIEEPLSDWQVSIENRALADAVNYLRKDPNIPTLDLILSCRWPVSRAQAQEIISQASAVLVAEAASDAETVEG